MNRTVFLKMFLIFLVGTLSFYSCEKDNLFDATPSDNITGGTRFDARLYDEFGPGLELVLSTIIDEVPVKKALLDLTLEMRTGDLEVLFTSFLSAQLEFEGNKQSMKDYLLGHSTGYFDEKELTAFTEAYPSLIIATRGISSKSWVEGTHAAPVVFVPMDFKESDKSITGSSKGQAIAVSLEQNFADIVVALHISERHDLSGRELTKDDLVKIHNPGEMLSAKPYSPSVDFSKGDQEGPLKVGMTEPTECPPVLPFVSSFTATTMNGHIALEYLISNFPNLGNWSRITIKRYKNGVEDKVFYRYAADAPFFEDWGPFDQNVPYTYTIDAHIFFLDSETQGPVFCRSEDNILYATAIGPENHVRVESFRGENLDDSHIKYNWVAPAGVPISQWRLSVYRDYEYHQVIVLPDSTTHYTYEYPADARGNRVEMRIEYKAPGTSEWQGDFFDRTFASYRSPGEPLYFYGTMLEDNSENLVPQNNENYLYGAPEINMLVLQAEGNASNSESQRRFEGVINTKPCLTVEVGFININFLSIPVFVTTATGYYYPLGYPNNRVPIIDSWNSELHGSALTVIAKETDINEVTYTQGSETTTQKFNASFGAKIVLGSGSTTTITGGGENNGNTSGNTGSNTNDYTTGIDVGWSSSEKIEWTYPSEDIAIGFDNLFFYHQPKIQVRGPLFFGAIAGFEGEIPQSPECEYERSGYQGPDNSFQQIIDEQCEACAWLRYGR